MSARYRKLSIKELEELEKEFVEFLIINGITADDWVKLKEQKPDDADKIIEAFSDVVFESILRKTAFLNFVSSSMIMAFQCLVDKMILVSMETDDEAIDFTKEETLTDLKEGKLNNNVKVFTQTKSYNGSRNDELFNMIQQGCSISNGDWFKRLSLLL